MKLKPRVCLVKRLGVLAFLGLGVTACKTRQYEQVTALKEELNAANQPSRMGLFGSLSWRQIRLVTRGETAFQPWSDTYWPLSTTGMALRWQGPGRPPETPFDQLKSLKEIVASRDPQKIVSLSVAEKFDLVSAPSLLPSDEQMAAIQEKSELYQNLGHAQLGSLETRARDLSEEYSRTQIEIREVSALLSLSEIDAKDREAATARLQGLLAQATSIDDKIRSIYKEYDELQEKLKKDRMPVAGQMARSLLPLRSSWPLLNQGWEVWGGYASRFDKDWGWMGHCHGWAAASLQYEAPLHAVIVQKKGLDIVFTPGDIRGLLSKLWADQPPKNERFGGERCNKETVVKDQYGRIVDGVICYDKSDDSCSTENGGLIIQKRNSFFGNAIPSIEFTDEKSPKNPRFANIKYRLSEDQYVVEVIDMWDALTHVFDLSKAKKRTAVLNLQTACRDTNPLLFHLSLVKLIAEKKQGFVIDRTRLNEVWNQPVYKFESTFVSLKKKDGTLSKPGEPVPLSDVIDVFKPYRSPRATSIVGVKTNVWYQLESGPLSTYSPDDESSQQEVFLYTLELDAFQNLVGGEWGLLPEAGAARGGALPNPDPEVEGRPHSVWVGGDVPDFLWYYDKGSKPRQGLINRQLVEQIYRCSRQPSAQTSVTVPLSGGTVNIPAVRCPL